MAEFKKIDPRICSIIERHRNCSNLNLTSDEVKVLQEDYYLRFGKPLKSCIYYVGGYLKELIELYDSYND